MANQASARPPFSNMGGMHLQNHKALPDTSSNVRYSDQPSRSDDTAQASTQHDGGRGSGLSASEEATNEDDDDEDSSGNKEDDQEEDDEDPEALAPSHGLGKGKGLRPAIRIQPAGEYDSQEDDDTVSHEAGLKSSKHPVNQLLMGDKKRTYSNLSSTSLLFGDDDGPHTFPRPKMARRLSYNDDKGLLTYQHSTDDNAIESSDDEEKVVEEDEEEDEDEDYSGVMNVPDDDTDIENMEQEEEQFIVNDEQQHGIDLFSASLDFGRRASIGSLASEDFLNFDMGGLMPYPEFDLLPGDPGFGQFFETEQAPPSSPEPLSKRKYSDSSTKRVRFDDEVQVSDSSSSSSDELDSATFPDLFMEQEKLPPSIYQQLIEDDNDSDHADFTSDGSDHSYWDYGQDESRHLATLDAEEFDDESSDPGSSGYETDMGDTTDEYDSDFGDNGPPNPRTPRQKTILRRPASAPSSRAPSPTPFRRGNVLPPPRGVFVHDDSRLAIAVTDSVTKKMTFYRPRASYSTGRSRFGTYSSTSSAANSPRTSVVQMNAVSDSELSNERFSNAWMGSDIMFTTGHLDTNTHNGFLMNGENIGPPEAFYPWVNIENGNIVSDEDDYDYDDEDFESDINLADFMDFGAESDDTDVDADEDTEVPATPATSMAAAYSSTPAQPTPRTETPIHRQADAMLEHFDRAGVTAFRNNQNRYHEIARLPHDPSIRASVSKPIRSGRSAETLMSPLRKRSSSLKKPRNSSFAGIAKATSRLQSSVMGPRRGPPMGTFS